MSKKLRVGIIGIGAIGKIHADAYQAAGEVEIAAVCDVLKDHLTSEADRLGVKERFTDYRKLIEADIDAVSVCVGNVLHREIAVASLKAGKHTLLEKPMAMNPSEAQEIADAANGSKGILQIGMVRRQSPEAQVLRQYVESGELGDIYHMRTVLIRRRGIPGLGGWFTTRALSGGGPMIDLGVHWFDAAMWLSGLWNPTSVSAKTYAKFGPRMKDYRYVGMWAGPPKLDGVFDVEDYSTGFVRFGQKGENGKDATMSFEIAWAANAEGQSFVEIMGEKGGARLFDGELRIFTEHNGRVADICPKFNAKANIFHLQARSFVDACRGKCPPAATGDQGVTVMKLIDAIYASSEANREVAIA